MRAASADQGIIPARAGFTVRTSRASSLSRDHPRSRGVYKSTRRRSPLGSGSSPLARGLRAQAIVAQTAAGIIPARAGFTGQLAQGGREAVDHPRSRGVYTSRCCVLDVRSGSSPLARGLLRPYRQFHLLLRIIPARAGFTLTDSTAISTGRDHPRSRGVYDLGGGAVAAGAGSSPLARGLPQRDADRGDSVGIIPARAGFTPARNCGRRSARDHPRSRGVYPCRSRQ